jgi:hypothetical protein
MDGDEFGKLPPLSEIAEEPGKDGGESIQDASTNADDCDVFEEDEEDDIDDEPTYGLDDEGQEEWAEMLRANTLNALFTGASVVVDNAQTAAADLTEQVCNITCSLDMFPQMYARQLQELDRTGKGKELRDFVYILRKVLEKCQRISGAITELCGRNEDVFGNLQNLVRVKGLEWHMKSLRAAGQHEILIKLLRNQLTKVRGDYEDVLDQYGDQCAQNSTLESQLEDKDKQIEDIQKRIKEVEAEAAVAKAGAATAVAPSASVPRKSTGSIVLGQMDMDKVHQMLGEVEKTTLEAAGKGKGAPPKGKGKGKPGPSPAGGEEATVSPEPGAAVSEGKGKGFASVAEAKGKGKGKPGPSPAGGEEAIVSPEPDAAVSEEAPSAAPKGKGKGKKGAK